MSTACTDCSPATRVVNAEDVVILDWAELNGPSTPELQAKIAKAYGYDGLGILAVRGVPEFMDLRNACLPYARKFAMLPEEVKSKYEHPESTYSFGWSHGKEKLEGKPDFAKGSYYFNPIHDRPVEDEAIMREHVAFAHPNIWPRDGDCPGFEEACKAAAGIIVRVGGVLARHTDAYVQSVDPTFTDYPLEKVIKEYRTHKARLLYYFPMNAEQAAELSNAADVSSWCGWHNDHGSLTGLTPAQFFSPEGEPIACPDPAAGLYIRSRKGETLRVPLPPDAIAYQIGEAAQVHTGGILQATPHCVRAAAEAGVGRGTLAVFMEPQWDAIMSTPTGAKPENVLRGARGELLPKGVPPLASRWEASGKQTFGEFTNKTLSMYY